MTIGAVLDARVERIERIVEECANVVFSGGTVIFPNDTSYTIACDPHRSQAVDRIYAGKRRADEKPLTLLLASPAEFLEHAPGNPTAILAAKRLLPAPVILTVRKPAYVSDEVAAGLRTIGLRVPDEPLARAILDRCGPLAATTANPNSGLRYDGGDDYSMLPPADLLVQNGPTPYDAESSIVDLSGTHPRLLREGVVKLERLRELLGPVERHTVKVRSQS